MMANTIQVSDNIWNWVSAASTLNDDNRALLELWRSGQKRPTFNQLEAFSNKVRIPLGYFFLSSPPTENLEILEFRTVDSITLQNPSRDLIDTIRQMESVQDWMRDYVVASQEESISFVGALSVNKDPLRLAESVRNALSLDLNWYENSRSLDDSFRIIRQAVSDIGVLVMMNGIVGNNTHRPLNLSEFRAFTLIDEFAPLIFINAADSKGGILFSLLHEFAHIGIGKSSLYNAGIDETNYINPYEVKCNSVAAEILVPISTFRDKWNGGSAKLDEKIQTVASYFKCSQSVIARRAFDCGFISNKEYLQFVSLVKKSAKAKSGGGDYYRTQASRIDRRFLLALDASLKEGRTLHTEAFRLTNTNLSTYDGPSQ